MTSSEESHPDEPDTLVGRVIAGNFRIDRLIGSGATGNVYQAEQLSLGKAVAVKILHPQLMADDKLVRRFQREAKSASRLNHPNSVQIIESGQDPSGTLFIAMELLSGRDLAEVIRDEFPLPVPRIIRIMGQVFAALDEAHAHGIIHRDLKPSNIMLIERRDETDFVKVCDYGIAKAAGDDALGSDAQMLTVQGLVCGTPEYMSPEQARGEALDGRTDLYSAAVILYQMTTGDVPFRAATPIGIVSRHLSEAPIVPSSRRADAAVPPALDDLILRGLAKSRDLRPATAAIFRDELERVSSTGVGRRSLASARTLPATNPATGATTAEVVAAPRRSGLGWFVAAVVGGVAIVGVLALVAFRRGAVGTARDQGATVAAPAVIAAALPAVPGSGRPAPAATASTEDRGRPAAPAEPGPALAGGPAATTGANDGPSAVAVTSAHDRSSHRRLAASTRGAHGAGAAGRAAGPGRPVAPAATKVEGTATAAPVASATAALHDGAAHSAPASKSDGAAIAGAAAPDDKAAVTAPAVPVAPPTRGTREIVAEAEKLLSQGEVAEACRRGEDAKRMAAKLPVAYRFLGKCYMRAGNAALAKDNYRRYLELAPNAPDALFIESIVKESAK